MDRTHKRILEELGPAALAVFRALEDMADERGRVRLDPKQIAAAINRKPKEDAA